MKKLCIYHGNCMDGFSAAWVVHKHYGEGNVDFHAGVYGEPPPDVTDREVIMVDFSYKRDVMLDIISKAKSLLVLDHHKTAMEDLQGLDNGDNIIVIFDMDRSGAMITWDFFNNEDPPQLLKHVEDRDLWRFKLPHTREIQAAAFSYEYNFENWDKMMLDTDLRDMVIEGTAIERKHFKDINELLKVSYQTMTIGGMVVKCANMAYTMSSDGCNFLMDMGEPIGACYYDGPQFRFFSLRSREGHPDVGQIAKEYGGGGHRNASGFRLTHEQANAIIVKP